MNSRAQQLLDTMGNLDNNRRTNTDVVMDRMLTLIERFAGLNSALFEGNEQEEGLAYMYDVYYRRSTMPYITGSGENRKDAMFHVATEYNDEITSDEDDTEEYDPYEGPADNFNEWYSA